MKCHYNERAEKELQQAMCGVVQCDCQVCGDSDSPELRHVRHVVNQLQGSSVFRLFSDCVLTALWCLR